MTQFFRLPSALRHVRLAYARSFARRLFAVASLIFPGAAALAQTSYTFTDLGGLPGLSYKQSYAFAINDSGEIAGSSYTAGSGGTQPHAIVWSVDATNHYAITDLAIPSAATGINNAGDVGTNFGFIVVPATVDGNLVWFEDQDGDGTNDLAIPIPTGGRAVMNDNLQVADGTHLVQFDPSGSEIVTSLPKSGHAVALNDAGEVAGYDSSGQAIVWAVNPQGNVLSTNTLAPPKGYTNGSALCIDALGHVAGYSSYTKKSQVTEHATLWTGPSAAPLDLGILTSGSGISQALGVNTVNGVVQVVGYSDTRTSGTAFLWKNGVMTDLNKLISAKGVVLQQAYAINSHGQIVGTASVTVGKAVETHGFLLTPN